MLERLLAGVSPRARGGITVALIAIGWIGFLIAVLGGLVLGVIVIVFGFALCWFAASMLATKPTITPGDGASGDSGDGGVEPDEPADIESRIKRRLEAMKQENPETET